jgi:hypothetical protein
VAQHPGLVLHAYEHVFLINDDGGHVIALATGFYEDERSNFAPTHSPKDGPSRMGLPGGVRS